jgi:hypothetical protein
MSDFHKLVISSPDGLPQTMEISLDGQRLTDVRSLTLRCTADEVVTAVIELYRVAVEYDGMAEVAAKIVRDEAPV